MTVWAVVVVILDEQFVGLVEQVTCNTETAYNRIFCE